MAQPRNKLYFGDNIDFLGEDIKPESVDLIYLDPPFNSNRAYNLIYKTQSGTAPASQVRAFGDTWHWDEAAVETYDKLAGTAPTRVRQMIRALHEFLVDNSNPHAGDDMMAYLVMMTARLLPMQRVLKPTGSIYLHCDPTASHYLKVVMDTIFGKENYRNEIIWKRTSAHNDPKRWGGVHDVLLFYTKSEIYTWNTVHQAYEESYLEAKYRQEDERGKYRLGDLTAAGVTQGDSGKPWRGYDPAKLGRHWAVSRDIVRSLVSTDQAAQMTTQEKLDLLDQHGFIYWTPRGRTGGTGFPQYKRYLRGGVPAQDVVTDIAPINSQAQERLGYPTQKPLALLERIIEASSNPGDVVMDPFAGCGTATAAAEKLRRRWIGIDITFQAIDLIRERMKNMFGLQEGHDYEVIGAPRSVEDAEQLARLSESDGRWQFQSWALTLVGAQPEGEDRRKARKGADAGVDGRISFQEGDGSWHDVIISVKSGNVDVKDVRELAEVVTHTKAALGVLITLKPPTEPMRKWALNQDPRLYESSFTGQSYPRLQILTIEQLLGGARIAMPPTGQAPGKKAPRVGPNATQTTLGLTE